MELWALWANIKTVSTNFLESLTRMELQFQRPLAQGRFEGVLTFEHFQKCKYNFFLPTLSIVIGEVSLLD